MKSKGAGLCAQIKKYLQQVKNLIKKEAQEERYYKNLYKSKNGLPF